MNTLKEYLEFYSPFGWDEKSIVVKYIQDNNLEGEYFSVLSSLFESSNKKMSERWSHIQEVIICYNHYGSGLVHNKAYSVEENQMMDRWINAYAVFGKLPDKLIEEARENVPKMDRPTQCFVDLINYIENTLNIKFKENVDK